jgi:hypothetical protein
VRRLLLAKDVSAASTLLQLVQQQSASGFWVLTPALACLLANWSLEPPGQAWAAGVMIADCAQVTQIVSDLKLWALTALRTKPELEGG